MTDRNACSFCGEVEPTATSPILVHDKGTAICATCVAAAVLSFANHAASGIVAAEGGQDPKGLDERSEQSPTGEAGDAQ